MGSIDEFNFEFQYFFIAPYFFGISFRIPLQIVCVSVRQIVV